MSFFSFPALFDFFEEAFFEAFLLALTLLATDFASVVLFIIPPFLVYFDLIYQQFSNRLIRGIIFRQYKLHIGITTTCRPNGSHRSHWPNAMRRDCSICNGPDAGGRTAAFAICPNC